ncbi:MAG: hypothetical protein ACR2RV_16545, partial [Verrucomicrobiales bacterium]
MRLRIEQSIGRDVLVWAVAICLLALSAKAEVPVGRVWERVDPRGSSIANDFTVFGNRLIAVGEAGAIWSTTDRENWTAERSQSSANLTAVASGAGVVVAVGSDGTILRSVGDGKWTREFPTSRSNFTSIAYGDGFVAVGDGGVALWSPDGLAWQDWPSGVPHKLNHVIWDGSAFHTVGDSGTVLTATRGGPWQSLIDPPSPFNDYAKISAGDNGYAFSSGSPHQDILYAGGRFVKVLENGYVSYSDDGNDWTLHPTPDDAAFCAAAWTGDEFIAMTRLRGIVTSTDTLRWMNQGLARNYLAGCWSGSRYIVVGAAGAIASSGDAATWTSEQNPTDHLLRDVTSGGGAVVAVGVGGTVLRSSDGQSWSQVEMLGDWDLYSVHWSGSKFWAVGTGGVILESPDGQVWALNNPGSLDAVVWDGSRYLAFSGRNVLSSDDGNQWAVIAHIEQPPGSAARSILHVRALIWDGTYFVAGAYSGYFFRSADGVNW